MASLALPDQLWPFALCSVCPFYSSRADIVPSQYVNPTWAAYPPEPEKLGELYELVGAVCRVVGVYIDTDVSQICHSEKHQSKLLPVPPRGIGIVSHGC